jgi:tRNA uridine 5-carbamoylmethylation protein Kti12
LCLAGLPASGKTTFARMFKETIEQKLDNLKVKIIDPDEIRKKITPNKFNYKKEQKIRLQNLAKISDSLKKGYSVISDDLNYYNSMRHDLKEIAEDQECKFFIIHISTPLEICLKWNELRGKPIPETVITNINAKFDDFGKYNWDYPIASIDLSQFKNLNEIIEKLSLKIVNTMNGPISKRRNLNNIAQNVNVYNELVDKVTRNIVSKLLQNPQYYHLRKKILKYRKLFIKKKLVKALDETLISKSFKDYLEDCLNLKIS